MQAPSVGPERADVAVGRGRKGDWSLCTVVGRDLEQPPPGLVSGVLSMGRGVETWQRLD